MALLAVGHRQHLRHGEVVAVDFGGIEQHLILHDRAAETGIVRDAGHGLVGALDHPVFIGLQLLRGAVRTLNHIAINQIGRARERRQAAGYARRQVGGREPLEYNLPGEIIVRAVFERHDDVGQAIQ